MAIYRPGDLLMDLAIRVSTIPLSIENIKYKIKNKLKKLSYDDIEVIEYNSDETPEFIYEDMYIKKGKLDDKEFKEIINVLKKNKVLKYKRHYFAKFYYLDGGYWELKIKFKNGYEFISSGDIVGPRNFHKVYKSFEEQIIRSGNRDLNNQILDKWFR